MEAEEDITSLTYSPDDEEPRLKIVLVGDSDVGKTFLLIRFGNAYPHNGHYTVKVDHNGKKNRLIIFELKLGREPETLTPPLAYTQVDIFIICFSLVSPSTLLAAMKWCDVLVHHRVPFILAGTKSELRDIIPKGIPHVETEQGERIAHKMGAVKYLECSATAQINIKDVFITALNVVFDKHNKRMRRQARVCSIM